MATSTERTPLLRQTTSTSISLYPNDSSFTKFAAETAIAAEADGAADPTHAHHGVGGKKEGDEKIKGFKVGVILMGLWASNWVFAFQSTALPTLAPRISTSFSHSELASYLGSVFPLFSTAFTPVYGVLLDSMGRKWAMGVSGLLYGLGSLACGLSPSMGWLIAARALTGAGGAGLLTVSSVITTDLTSLRERGFYQGLMMIVFGLGASLGGPLSGWIADRFSWPWAFYIQIPPLILSLIIIFTYLPNLTTSQPRPSFLHLLRSFDILGTLLLLISFSSLLLAFSNHTASLYPWSAPRVWGMLVTFGVTLGAFVWNEKSWATDPIVPLGLFRGQTLPFLYLSNFTLSIAAQTFLFHIPIFFTNVLDTTSATAGAHLLPNSVGLAIGSILAGQIIKKTGKYTTLSAIGLAMPILGIYSASKWSSHTPEWAYWLAIFPAGLGYSIFLCCGLVALIASVDPEQMPKATSLLYTFRSVGTTNGIALSSSFQQAVYVKNMRAVLPNDGSQDRIINAILHSKTAIYSLPPSQQAAVERALANSLSWTFVMGSAAAIACLLTSLPIRDKDLSEGRKRRGVKDDKVLRKDDGNGITNGNGNPPRSGQAGDQPRHEGDV